MTFIWRRTFPDTHHDFVADEAGVHVGRIRRMEGGPQNGTWTWSCTGCQRGHEAEGVRPLNGMADTRDEAIEALAAAWGRAKAWSARTGLPLTPGAQNEKAPRGGAGGAVDREPTRG